MGKVKWTHEALFWLREIHDYIAEDNPSTAQDIYERTQALADFPEIGYRYQRWPDTHIRILLHDQYRIAYVLKENGDIHILGIFHGAMDINRYLKRRE